MRLYGGDEYFPTVRHVFCMGWTQVKSCILQGILEVTLTEAFNQYKALFSGHKTGQQSFEKLRPRGVGFTKACHRDVFCCFYHTNLASVIESDMSVNTGRQHVFNHVQALVNATQSVSVHWHAMHF